MSGNKIISNEEIAVTGLVAVADAVNATRESASANL